MTHYYLILVVLLFAGCTHGGTNDNSIHSDEFPTISQTYIAEGTLYIPYAEIEEPFSAWLDMKKGLSRIDFYGGVSKTYQLSNLNEYGVMRKIVPMTTDTVLNQLSCFEVNGTALSTIQPQSILPDPAGFEFAGEEVVNGKACKKYVLTEKKGQKLNTYTYWIKVEKSLDHSEEIGIPVRYDMKGYNTLLGSHFDHYYLDYNWFSGETPDDDIFNIPETLPCNNFPGPGSSHHQTIATFNPMKEFVHHYDEHITNGFDDFIAAHNKKYEHDREAEKRLNIFRHNFRFIHSSNRRGKSYRLAVNHLADRTENELKVLRGRRFTKGYNGADAFPYTSKDIAQAKLPEYFDWRLYGAVTPVKDQSVCGSCWSFGAIGTVESANFVKTGLLIRLSQQALIDCSWGYGNNGCDGGEDFRSYQWMLKHQGIPSADSYGPYLSSDGFCHVQNTSMAVTINGYVNVTSGDAKALKMALVKHGAISVGIDASHKTLSFYANGVYFEPKCGNKLEELDHAVLLVGYGTLNGEPYWLVKNSWSTYWGNDGYVLMSQKDNNCGVETAATYVTL